MELNKRHLLLCAFIICLPPTAATSNGVCSLGKIPWNPGAPARFGLSISLRKVDQANPLGCGMVSQESLQLYVAAQWACERLNADLGNGSFVPGVQFGFDLLDDCRSSHRAVQYALDYVDLYSDYCHLNDNSTADPAASLLRIGIVGPSRSSTAEETADSMRSIPLPIVSPSATLASLTEGDTPHPNFFRTVPSDKVQIKTIVAILKQLQWSFLVVVYTDDNYGAAGSRLLQEEARAAKLCVNESIPIHTHTPMDSVVSRLVRARQATEGESMAVVYIGQKDKAENLVFNVRSLRAYGFHFIMSDSVSTNTDVFNSGRLESGINIALGSLTLAPSSVILQEFQDYLNQKYLDVKEGRVQDDVIRSYLEESGLLRSSEPLHPVSQITFVPLAVSAIFALAEATRQAQADRCGAGVAGVCPALLTGVRDGDILTRLPQLQVNFGTMTSGRAPRELKDAGYVLEFDDNGDVVPKPELPDYTVFAYADDAKNPYHKVGTYSGGELTLDMSPVQVLDKNGHVTSELPTSVCAGSCPQCADDGKVPLAYINGSAYIVGIFSMHDRNADQPFKCGDFRNVSKDAVALEAFLHAVEQAKRRTGINFGAVAFDDCYSSLHITSILSDFLSGLVPFDKGLFEVCVPEDRVVGMVGSLSSDCTLAVASFNTPQRIPTISYAASSPDLDDTITYPFFLRTVPSDEEQAIAMTELILAMEWQYVGLLYVSNNYGTKGALAFKRVANERGVCVATPVAISVNPTNMDESQLYDAFVTLIKQKVKVVVFFGIDSRMADFLRLIESRNEQGSLVFIASEDWGTKNDVLAAGQKAARGSITFKVDNTYIDPAVEESLRTRLLEKRPREDDVNPWFSEFWQHIFDCNTPGGFNNIFTRNCDSNTRLSAQQVDSMLSDQRVKHVMNAVQAMASGLAQAGAQICEDAFPCPFLRSQKYATEVFDAIKSQTVTMGSIKEQLFDQNGNGNIGFSIYNIQRQRDGYVYVPVGVYSKKNRLQITKENLQFYTDTGLPLDRVESACSEDLCAAPECATTPEVVPTPAPEVTTDGEFRVADVVIVIVLVVFCLVLLCCMCLGFKYFRQKIRSLTKELQDNKNEPIYHMVSTPRQPTYGNLDPAHRVMSLPLPSMPMGIHFVNGGLSTASNSPGNTLDGRNNPAFVPDTTPVRETASALGTSPSPLHRRRGCPPPPPPPLPDPCQAPPFHHSMSAVARLQRDDNDSGSASNSPPHNYYTMHSANSNRELPALPIPTAGAQSSSRSFRSFQSCPSESPEREENIPMQNLSPGRVPKHAASSQLEKSHYLHATESSPSVDGNEPVQEDENSIQYFRMTPSGQLEGEEEEENANALRTYTLSPPEEDPSTLNTYSSPQRGQAAQQQPSPPRLRSQEGPPRDRSDSLPATQYAGVLPSQERSDTPNTFPGSFIQPLRITPQMRDIILQQIMLDSMGPAQPGMGYPAGGAEMQPSSLASSTNSAVAPRPPQLNHQRSQPASMHYPSSEGAGPVTAPPRHSYPWAWDGRQMSLAPEDYSASTVQTGVYTPFFQLPQYSLDSQPTPSLDLPETDLSTPYTQLAQGEPTAPHTPHMSRRGADENQSPLAASDFPNAGPRSDPREEMSQQPPQQQQQQQQLPHPQPPPPAPQPQERQRQQHGQLEQPPAQLPDEEKKLWTSYGMPMNISTV